MSDAADARNRAIGEFTGRGRLVTGGVALAFWGWLLARWAAHNGPLDDLFTALGVPDLIRSEAGVRGRDPWFPSGPLEGLADAVGGAAAALGPASFLLDWLRWLLDLAAFAATVEPAMAAGAVVTVVLTVASIALGLVIAVPLSLARVYGGPVVSRLALGYTELIRGTPLLAQLFLLYFALPLAGIATDVGASGNSALTRPATFVAILGFTINSSAYQSEYIRGALESVDPGQLTAARAVGMSRLQGIRHVVLPQGLRYAIPGWTNEFVYLVKYSSLAAFVTVPELFRRANDVAADTFRVTEIYTLVALLYLGLVITTAVGMSALERRVALPGVGGPAED